MTVAFDEWGPRCVLCGASYDVPHGERCGSCGMTKRPDRLSFEDMDELTWNLRRIEPKNAETHRLVQGVISYLHNEMERMAGPE